MTQLLIALLIVALIGIMEFVVGFVIHTLLSSKYLGKMRFVFTGIFVFLGSILGIMAYVMLTGTLK